jgi:hypothetical protein
MKITKFDVCIAGIWIAIGLMALLPFIGIVVYRP